jgi:hypothetical protein
LSVQEVVASSYVSNVFVIGVWCNYFDVTIHHQVCGPMDEASSDLLGMSQELVSAVDCPFDFVCFLGMLPVNAQLNAISAYTHYI